MFIISKFFVPFPVGPLTATVACDSVGFLNQIKRSQSYQGPSYQYHINAVSVFSDYGTHIPKTFGIKPEVLNPLNLGVLIQSGSG